MTTDHGLIGEEGPRYRPPPGEAPLIPKVMIGTSPFLGAGQFGPRAITYREKFYEQPRNITRLVEYCAKRHGVRGVQALADPVIVQALREVEHDLEVVAVVGLGPLREDVRTIDGMNLRAVLLHASLVDGRDPDDVLPLLRELRDRFEVPVGIATHRPDATLPRWESREGVDVYMVPLNPEGAFMGDRKRVEEILEDTDRTIIAKKVLAAGSIPPEEGIPYAAQYADAVAVGITSRDEANETLPIAKEHFR